MCQDGANTGGELYIRHRNAWFKFRDVKADGNCMYHCLALCPATPLDSIDDIRKVLAKMMRKPSEHLMNFFVEYHKTDENPEPSLEKWRDSVLKDTEWGSNFESSLFGAIYGVDVRIVTNSLSGFEESDTRTLLEMYQLDSEKMIPKDAPTFYLYLHEHMHPQQPTQKPNHFAILDSVSHEPPEGSIIYNRLAEEAAQARASTESSRLEGPITPRRPQQTNIYPPEPSQENVQRDLPDAQTYVRRRSSFEMSAFSTVLSEVSNYSKIEEKKSEDARNAIKTRRATLENRKSWGNVMSEMSQVQENEGFLEDAESEEHMRRGLASRQQGTTKERRIRTHVEQLPRQEYQHFELESEQAKRSKPVNSETWRMHQDTESFDFGERTSNDGYARSEKSEQENNHEALELGIAQHGQRGTRLVEGVNAAARRKRTDLPPEFRTARPVRRASEQNQHGIITGLNAMRRNEQQGGSGKATDTMFQKKQDEQDRDDTKRRLQDGRMESARDPTRRSVRVMANEEGVIKAKLGNPSRDDWTTNDVNTLRQLAINAETNDRIAMFERNNPSSGSKQPSVTSNSAERMLSSDDTIRSSTSKGREEESLKGSKPVGTYKRDESLSSKDRQTIRNRRISITVPRVEDDISFSLKDLQLDKNRGTHPRAQNNDTIRRYSEKLVDQNSGVSTLATTDVRQRDVRVRAPLRQSAPNLSTPSRQLSIDDSRQRQLSDEEIILRNFGTPGGNSDRPSNSRRSFTMNDSQNRWNHTDIGYEVNPESVPRRAPGAPGASSLQQQSLSPRKSIVVHPKAVDSKTIRQTEVSRDGNREPMVRRISSSGAANSSQHSGSSRRSAVARSMSSDARQVQQLDIGNDDIGEYIPSRKSGANSPQRSGSPRRSVTSPGLFDSRPVRQLEIRHDNSLEGIGVGKPIATGLQNNSSSPRRPSKSNPRPNDARQTRHQDVGPTNYNERQKSAAPPLGVTQYSRQSSEQTHQELHRRNTENDLVIDTSSIEGQHKKKKISDVDRRGMGESIRSNRSAGSHVSGSSRSRSETAEGRSVNSSRRTCPKAPRNVRVMLANRSDQQSVQKKISTATWAAQIEVKMKDTADNAGPTSNGRINNDHKMRRASKTMPHNLPAQMHYEMYDSID